MSKYDLTFDVYFRRKIYEFKEGFKDNINPFPAIGQWFTQSSEDYFNLLWIILTIPVIIICLIMPILYPFIFLYRCRYFKLKKVFDNLSEKEKERYFKVYFSSYAEEAKK